MKREEHTQRWPSVLTEEAGDLICNTFGAGEDQNLVGADFHDFLEMPDHLVALLEVGYNLNDLVDPMVSRQVHRTDVDLDVVVEEVGGKLADLLGPSGGPHASLSIRANLGDDGANLRLETHVQHTISLIKNEIGDTAKVSTASVQHIDQTTRSSNANLHTTAEVANLRALRDTTVDAGIANTGRFSKLGHLSLDLNRKLTSRGEDKNNRTITRSEQRLGVDVDNSRKAVGEGLSRAGLSNTNDITAREGHRPTLSLDGGWVRETLSLHFRQNILREPGLVESLNRTRDVPSLDGHLVLLAVVLNITLRAVGNIGMLLVEGFLELWQGVQI